MSDVLFILKSFLLTGLIIILLQIRIGKSTIEDHTITWLESSSITRPLYHVTSGGAMALRNLWGTIVGNIETRTTHTTGPGQRSLKVEMTERLLEDEEINDEDQEL